MNDLVHWPEPAQAARQQIVGRKGDEQTKSGNLGELKDRSRNDEVVCAGYPADGFVYVGVNVLQFGRTILSHPRDRFVQFTKGRKRTIVRFLIVGGKHLLGDFRLQVTLTIGVNQQPTPDDWDNEAVTNLIKQPFPTLVFSRYRCCAIYIARGFSTCVIFVLSPLD